MRRLTGLHVFAMFGFAFGAIIVVNMTLALNAVRTFPGLEVKNSYVASQGFEEARSSQEALDWDVSAELKGGELIVRFDQAGAAIAPEIVSAVFGRATTVASDQTPQFDFHQGAYRAQVTAGLGNWNLRVVARAADGTQFKQRIIVEVEG